LIKQVFGLVKRNEGMMTFNVRNLTTTNHFVKFPQCLFLQEFSPSPAFFRCGREDFFLADPATRLLMESTLRFLGGGGVKVPGFGT